MRNLSSFRTNFLFPKVFCFEWFSVLVFQTWHGIERILTELSDKLNQWHSKLCKKYSDSVSQLKRSKRQIEEKLGAAEQKLKYLAAKRESTQSSIENLLKPYASSISLDCQNLPGRDTLVSEIFRMVEKLEDVLPISLSSVFAIFRDFACCEFLQISAFGLPLQEPMISSVISTAVEKLISRSPEKKLEEVSKNMSKDQEVPGIQLGFAHLKEKLSKQDVKWLYSVFFCAKFDFSVQRHRLVHQGQPAMLDFASVQQMLQYTSAAQATDDLTPFLSESQKSPPLLLRGPVPASVRRWFLISNQWVSSHLVSNGTCGLGGLIHHSNKPAKFRRAKHNSYRVFPIRAALRLELPGSTPFARHLEGVSRSFGGSKLGKNSPGWHFYKLIEVRLLYF